MEGKVVAVRLRGSKHSTQVRYHWQRAGSTFVAVGGWGRTWGERAWPGTAEEQAEGCWQEH